MMSLPTRRAQVTILCVLMAIAVASLDLLSPLGVAAAALYSLVIAASLLANDPRLTQTISVFSLALIVLGGLASPDSSVPAWMVALNRAIFMVMATITALLGLYRQRAVRQIRDQQLQLEQVNRELARQARSDGLTGLANRRAFDEQLANECARTNRYAQPLSLLMIDVDHFKLFNDKTGHPSGDEALKAVAATIQQALRRPVDLAARYGGEELAVILPTSDATGACERAEEIRCAVEALAIPHPGLSAGAVLTVSVGVATLTSSVSSETLIQRADAALYRAKSAGRNKVSCEH